MKLTTKYTIAIPPTDESSQVVAMSNNGDIYIFNSYRQAKAIRDWLVEHMNLDPSFEVRQTHVMKTH
jgi:hypothetical protein